MRYCAHGPLGLMALAWPKLHGSAKLAMRPGLLGLAACARSRGARSPWRAGDGGRRFWSLAARGGREIGRGAPRQSGGPIWGVGGGRGLTGRSVHGGETTVRGSSGGVGGVVEYCDATTELGVVEGHRFRGRTRLSPMTSALAVDSFRGRKYLLGSDARHPRTAATGLNQQLVGARSRGAWQLGG
jgi:hypothetical protein